jgi:hypothetical protein
MWHDRKYTQHYYGNSQQNNQDTINYQQSIESKENIETDIQWERQHCSRQQRTTTLLRFHGRDQLCWRVALRTKRGPQGEEGAQAHASVKAIDPCLAGACDGIGKQEGLGKEEG